MSGLKNFHLNVNDPSPVSQPGFEVPPPAEDYQINIEVANGWAISGHYKNNVLQTITLSKTPVATN